MGEVYSLIRKKSSFKGTLIDLFSRHGHNKSMQKQLVPILGLILLLTGCAAVKPQGKKEAPVKELTPKSVTKKAPTKGKGLSAVWSNLSEDEITLYFKNIEEDSNLSVILEKGLNKKIIGRGSFELTGFEYNGKSYVADPTVRKFIFNLSLGSVYAGSILKGCPKIVASEHKVLKRMKFFDRYSFSSPEGGCELIVGNDFISVQSEVKKSKKHKSLKLKMGF